MAFEWTEKISVGNEALDNQHKKLLAEIDRLLTALNQDKGVEMLSEIIGFLDDYIIGHLAYEEQYMQNHAYPDYPRHKKIHENFIKKYDEFKKELTSGTNNKILANKVQTFLGSWWLTHIAEEDHKYYEFIKSHPNAKKMLKEAIGHTEQ